MHGTGETALTDEVEEVCEGLEILAEFLVLGAALAAVV